MVEDFYFIDQTLKWILECVAVSDSDKEVLTSGRCFITCVTHTIAHHMRGHQDAVYVKLQCLRRWAVVRSRDVGPCVLRSRTRWCVSVLVITRVEINLDRTVV